VLRTIAETGTGVSLRHIWDDPQHRADLQAARGRSTVPVLRITDKDGDRWMPESADIVRYLHELART
jgi:glutaredoxin 2